MKTSSPSFSEINRENSILKTVETKKDVRQGYVLSPLLLNIYIETTFREVMNKTFYDIKDNEIFVLIISGTSTRPLT